MFLDHIMAVNLGLLDFSPCISDSCSPEFRSVQQELKMLFWDFDLPSCVLPAFSVSLKRIQGSFNDKTNCTVVYTVISKLKAAKCHIINTNTGALQPFSIFVADLLCVCIIQATYSLEGIFFKPSPSTESSTFSQSCATSWHTDAAVLKWGL